MHIIILKLFKLNSNIKLSNLHYAKALAQYFEEEKIDAISVAAHSGKTASELKINTRNMGGAGFSGLFSLFFEIF